MKKLILFLATFFTVPALADTQVYPCFSTTANLLSCLISNYSIVWPEHQGAGGSTLINDGSGNLSWGTPAINIAIGNPVAGGDPNSVLFVDSDSNLAQSTNFVFTGTNFGIGTSAPSELLDVSGGFQVDGNGNVLKIHDVATSWPSSQGAANTVLLNNGSGTLSWFPTSTSSVDSTIMVRDSSGNFAANQGTFTNLVLNGSSSGTTTLQATPVATGTLSLPAVASTDTLTANANTATLTNKSMSGVSNTFTNIPLSTAVTGVLPISNGGTGVTAVTLSPTASTFAGWDGNLNLSANSDITGYATTATAAATTTLVVGSAQQQYFTGTTTQTVKLPVTSTLVLGQSFYVTNNSTGAVTVQSSGSNTVQTMVANSFAVFTCIATSGTSASSWSVNYSIQAGGGGGTVTQVTTTAPLNVTNGTTTPALTISNVTQSVAGTVASAGQLLGTNTNDTASSGNAGEIVGPISRVRSNSTTLTSGTTVNVGTTTHITLTAGDWRIYGAVAFQAATSTVIGELKMGVSKTSATVPANDTIAVPTNGEVYLDYAQGSWTSTSTDDVAFTLPVYRYSVANGNTQDLYLVAQASFTTSTCKVYGSLYAERAR